MEEKEEALLEMRQNTVDVDLYLKLRGAVNWPVLDREQARRALENSLVVLCVYLAGQPIGMGRLVGDGAVICYIQDLIIHPHAQRMGVGRMLIEGLKTYAESLRMPGTTMMLDLMCAKGREPFYMKFGFIPRPTEKLGPGMILYLHDEKKSEIPGAKA